MVPAYQPEAAYQIFMRTMLGLDVATGRRNVTDDYGTAGPASTWHIRNEVLSAPEPECYILAPETYETVKNGSARVENWIVTSDTVRKDASASYNHDAPQLAVQAHEGIAQSHHFR